MPKIGMPIAIQRNVALLQLGVLYAMISVSLVVLVPAWSSSTRADFWTPFLVIAYICLAWVTIFAARLTERVFARPGEGLFIRDGDLIYLDPLTWRLKISAIESVAIASDTSKPPALELLIKGGGSKRLPLVMLDAEPIVVRDEIAQLIAHHKDVSERVQPHI